MMLNMSRAALLFLYNSHFININTHISHLLTVISESIGTAKASSFALGCLSLRLKDIYETIYIDNSPNVYI